VIIADSVGPATPVAPARTARVAAVLVALVGAAAAIYYAQAGLTLSHYDARGHLVVARRIMDSLTPGWQQVGAVWLPLPHLLNMIPVQIDYMYRTGLSAVVLSIGSAALAAYALAALVEQETRSRVAALAAASLLALNPNPLYLQSTPMTEPLLLGLMLLATWQVRRWLDDPAHEALAGVAIFLACWTRYEAWPVTAALLALSLFARVRLGQPAAQASRRTLRLALYPAAAVVLFVINSRITIGEWFVSSGFFVAENPALHDPLRAAGQVISGAATLAGVPLAVAGGAAALVVAGMGVWKRERAASLVLLAPLAAGALPWYAFVQGHPFRVRYMVVQVAALALVAGVAAGWLRRSGAAAAVLLVAVTLHVRPPLDASAAMVREAQWDRRNAVARTAVSAALAARHDGTPILASMGSLGHYMQELSHAGFHVRHFVHEGNGELWKAAYASPATHVRWILIEEKAEGGDMLAERARRDPGFLAGFSRVIEGGGVALYARDGALDSIHPGLEAHPHREVHRPPSQIQLVAEEPIRSPQRQIPLAGLIAELAAHQEVLAERNAEPAQEDRRGSGVALHVARAEKGAVERVDELSGFAVAPVQHREAAAQVRLQAVGGPAQREEPHRCGDRNDAQPQVLLDLATPRPHQVAIHAGHRPPVKAHADARLDEGADAEQPVGPDRRAPEIADLVGERVEIAQVRDQRVPLDPGVFPFGDESADVETQDLRLRLRGRRDQQDPDHQRHQPHSHAPHDSASGKRATCPLT
jgi:hypothetical protein